MIPFRAALPFLLGCLLAYAPASAQEAPSTPQPPLSARIVNGVLTDSYPSTGALLAPADSSAELVCTGTMIGCRTFLTAAHCVCDGAGDECPSAELDAPGHMVFLQHAGFLPVERITVHPDYVFPDYDIAVVRLGDSVSGVSPSALPNATPSVGTPGTLVGFGRSGGSADDFGLKRSTRIELATCPSDLGPPLQICWDFLAPVGNPGEDGNTCNGDSGGPLFVDLGLGPVIGGVTSGGTTPDCFPPDESWDTNVHYFDEWVRAQAGSDVDATSCGALSQVGELATVVYGFSGELSAKATQAAHMFDVSAGTAELRVTLNASEEPGNDFDLSVRATEGAAPPECEGNGSGQWAACSFTAPPAGAWELLVRRIAGEGEYQVTATTFVGDTEPPPNGGPQSRKQQKCVKVQGKLGRKAALAEARNVSECMSNAARARPERFGTGSQVRTAQACLTNDVRDRVAKVARKLEKKDQKVCSKEPPDFGYAGAAAAGSAPVDQWVALVGDLFGPELGAALASDATDEPAVSCQQEVVDRASAVWDAATRTALTASKNSLGSGAETGPDLATALTSAWQSDPSGKISKAASKLQKRLGKQCDTSAFASLFPGACGAAETPDAFAACVASRAMCRQCLAESAARSLEIDCDVVDDQASNASCS